MSVASWCCKSLIVVPCASFCTGHFVMVPLNMTYLHCLQHYLLNISSIYIVHGQKKDLPHFTCIFHLLKYVVKTFLVLAILHHISLLRLLPKSYFKISIFQPSFLCSIAPLCNDYIIWIAHFSVLFVPCNINSFTHMD